MSTPGPHPSPEAAAAPASIAEEVRRALDAPALADLAQQAEALEELHARLAAALATIDRV